MPTEAITSQLPVGAGRFSDYVWPDPQGYSASNVGGNLRGRHGFGSPTGQAVARTQGIAGGTSMIAAALNGVGCAQIPCTAGAPGSGTQVGMYQAGSVQPRTTKGFLGPWADDESAYRIVVNMAGGGQTMSGDFGFQLVRQTGLTGGIFLDTNDGIGLQIANANVVQLLVRGPNGLITVPLTAAPFDTTTLHSYQLEIVSATPTAEAGLALFIDQTPIALAAANSSWGAGTNLPPMQLSGGKIGFMPTVIAAGNGNSNLFVQKLHVMAAPSILMTF